MKRLPWGHTSRHCLYCGHVGPRTSVVGGYAHKRCIPGAELKARKVKPAQRVPFRSSGSGYAITGVDMPNKIVPAAKEAARK